MILPNKNRNNEHHDQILHVRVSLSSKFQLKLNTGFLDQICPTRVIPVENKTSEQHHCILHIRVRLGAKFHFKLTILNFGTTFQGQISTYTDNFKQILDKICPINMQYTYLVYTKPYMILHQFPEQQNKYHNQKSENFVWI